MKDTDINKCVCTDLTEVPSGSLTLSTVYQVHSVLFQQFITHTGTLIFPSHIPPKMNLLTKLVGISHDTVLAKDM